jgi:putative ABC transport system substrate-binding protein
MLWNAEVLGMSLRCKAAEVQARSLRIAVESLGMHARKDFEAAFSTKTRSPPDALTILNREQGFDFAAQHRLPAIYEHDFLVRQGGLMS